MPVCVRIKGDSKPLLKPSTMKMMISNPIKDLNSSHQYGFGILISKGLNGPIIGHSGTFLGYKSEVKIDVKTGIGIAVLLNVAEEDSLKYWNLALKTIGNALQGLPPKFPKIDKKNSKPIELSRESNFCNIIGYYRCAFGYFNIYENSEGTLMLDTLSMQLINNGPGQIDFKLGWEAPFTDVIGDHASFYLDCNGKVERLIIANTIYCYRIKGLQVD